MTDRQISFWIRDNLGKYIRKAIEDYKKVNPTHIFTDDWLAGIAHREVPQLIDRYHDQKLKFEVICSLMKGDYSKREHDKEKCYHGFSFWQIDIDSFPEWVKSGAWKDPYKSCYKAITVLDNKRKYIVDNCPAVKNEDLCRAITAAYNCGEGRIVRNVLKVNIKANNRDIDIDAFTHEKNYSAMVWRYRDVYRNLPEPSVK